MSGMVKAVSSEDALLIVLFVLMLSEPVKMEIMVLFTLLTFTQHKLRQKEEEDFRSIFVPLCTGMFSIK